MSTGRHWELWGCGLWVLGSLGFLITGIRSGDAFAIIGSLLFIVGIAMFAMPWLARGQ